MLLSALFVRFRDLQPIWDVASRSSSTARRSSTSASNFPDKWEHTCCSPIAVVLSQMRKALIDPSAPSAAGYVGGTPRLLFPIGIVLGIFGLGSWVFDREAPRIAENL